MSRKKRPPLRRPAKKAPKNGGLFCGTPDFWGPFLWDAYFLEAFFAGQFSFIWGFRFARKNKFQSEILFARPNATVRPGSRFRKIRVPQKRPPNELTRIFRKIRAPQKKALIFWGLFADKIKIGTSLTNTPHLGVRHLASMTASLTRKTLINFVGSNTIRFWSIHLP